MTSIGHPQHDNYVILHQHGASVIVAVDWEFHLGGKIQIVSITEPLPEEHTSDLPHGFYRT